MKDLSKEKEDELFLEKEEPISHRTKNITIMLLLLVIAALIFALILK
jgi:hypothetical protein